MPFPDHLPTLPELPREIEVAIDAFPELQSSFVVGLPDPVGGQNVAAAIVLDAKWELAAAACRRRRREQLSTCKVSRGCLFCAEEEFPFTDTG